MNWEWKVAVSHGGVAILEKRSNSLPRNRFGQQLGVFLAQLLIRGAQLSKAANPCTHRGGLRKCVYVCEIF
jgi:hypothetical protein